MAIEVKIQNSSRLRYADFVVVDDVAFWDLSELPDIPVSSDDKYHTVLATDFLDSIANTYYNDPGLDWIIAAANNLEIIPTDLKEGMTLRIPSPLYIDQKIKKKL